MHRNVHMMEQDTEVRWLTPGTSSLEGSVVEWKERGPIPVSPAIRLDDTKQFPTM